MIPLFGSLICLEVIEEQVPLARERVKTADVAQHQRIRGIGLHCEARPLFSPRRFAERLQGAGAK